MALSTSARIGVYEVLNKLGEGGMGEVYRARDTKLDRDVALKILPETFASDSDRLARFEREARTLASLNHPHIAQIYGFEDRALVMELVEGEDLSTRIARGPIPFDEALAIAREIADALEAAHQSGIIHRDLKPANIKVRSDGTSKVLDFGLAKPGPIAPARSGTALDSPTITSPAALTMGGVILGTAAYMSPEQAKGRPVDKRADIWAFGCVLYEMVTARRPFDGEDITDTIAAVVSKEPDWSRVPAPLTRLLQQCLQKDPRKRLRGIGDAWSLIDDAPRAVGATAASRGPLTFALAGAAAIATIAAVALAYVHFSEQPPAGSRIMRRQATGEGSDEVLVASAEGQTPTSLSRDGQVLAFGFPRKETRSPDLFVFPLTGPADRRKPYALAATPLIEVDPQISPDGRWVAYVEQDPGSAGRIGRGEIYVRPFPASPEAQPKGTKWQVSSEGAGFPRWLAGGRQLSYVTGPEAAQRIVVVDVLQASDAARGAQAFQWVR